MQVKSGTLFILKNFKNSFTLAEILVVFVILGVLAALTIPTILWNNQRKQLEAGFKSSYAIAASAYKLMAKDYDVDDATYCNPATKTRNFIEDFSQYVKYQRYITTSTQNLKLVDLGYPVNRFKNSYGGGEFDSNSHDNGAIILANGAYLFFDGCWTGSRVGFTIDTNGPKPPNRVGYDVFFFQTDNRNNTIFTESWGNKYAGFGEDKLYCRLSGSSGVWNTPSIGATCALYAVMDINPEDETKSFWGSLPRP